MTAALAASVLAGALFLAAADDEREEAGLGAGVRLVERGITFLGTHRTSAC